jgi:glycosyltransferase involved in cell wall biosynthesis
MRASAAIKKSEVNTNPATETSLAGLNFLERPICLTYPARVAVSAWIGHVPFAFYLIEALRPKAVAELGAHYGVSYCAFCQAVKELGLDTRCYAVDSWQGDVHTGFYGPDVLADLEQHHNPLYGGFSRLIQSTFDEAVGYFADNTFDLLHIDGFHTYEAVKKDFEKWLPKMTDRGIVLFHDINVREREFGVWRFWEEVKKTYPHFEFVHSHGLGVLAIGKDYPESLQGLFQASGEARARIRSMFSQLGGRLELAQELHLLRPTIEELKTANEEKERELKRNAQQLQEKDTLIHERNVAAIVFQEQRQESERQLAARDTLIHERDLALSSLTQQLQERDRLVDELNLQAAANSQLIREQQQLLQENPQLADLHQQQLQESLQQQEAKDRLLESQVLIIEKAKQEIEALGLQRQTEVQQLSELEKQLQLKERQLQLKHRQLSEREQSENEKNQLLHEQDLQLTRKHKEVQELVLQVKEKIREVQNKSQLIELYNQGVVEFANSGSYRLGRAISWPLRAVKQQLRTILNGNDVANDPTQPQLPETQVAVSQEAATAEIAVPEIDAAFDYGQWVKLFDTLTDADREAIITRIDKLGYKPLISVLMPVYNVEEVWLRKAIDSVLDQLYPHWELCIADDCSTQTHVGKVLEEYARKDSRIKVAYRKTNGHISAASNSALDLATGEFIALLDNDDELPEQALYAVAEELNEHPRADLVYSDEDKIDQNGQRREPHFKPDWSPDYFYSCNMISHLGVYRASIVKKINGFREGFEGSQDYDLALRFIEQIPEEHIRHIPNVLYHWRAIAGSVALASEEKDYAHEAARRAIRSHLKRTQVKATVSEGHGKFHQVSYPLPDPAPLTSLIIATRDRVELLSQTVDGLLNGTDYSPIEIIIVDNQSKNAATLKYLREVQQDERVKVVEYDAPFNYSALNNLGVRESSGEFIGLINNDIKVISPGWLGEMVSHAARRDIGAVGAKLLYHDDTVQHAGVILGVNGVAAHVHRFIPKEGPGYFNRARVIQNFSAVTGACMVMRREVFDEVGGLDEINLPVAFNDIDLCIRIRERGYRIVWTPYAELYHLESASRGRDDTLENAPRFRKEVEYMMHIWEQVLWKDPYYNPNLTLIREDFSLAVPPRVTKSF